MHLIHFKNKKLKKLVHVYQLNYINGKSPGLGDFLRGSFSFMQLSKLYNLDFDIDFSNHPMSKYLENTEKKHSTVMQVALTWRFLRVSPTPCIPLTLCPFVRMK